MHIMLISVCEKRARKRSAAILDSYALRTGTQTWATPITREALEELKIALRRKATRQTAVACYVNDGRRRMKFEWAVGSVKKFGKDGTFPCATKVRKLKTPAWVKEASHLVCAGGIFHDVGKASEAFQQKLRNTSGSIRDAIRHEWLSMKVLQFMRFESDAGFSQQGWTNAWLRIKNDQHFRNEVPFKEFCSTANDAIDFLVVTHHKLLSSEMKSLTSKGHVRELNPHISQVETNGNLSQSVFEIYKKKASKLSEMTSNKDPLYWRPLIFFARAALIFADHSVSSRDRTQMRPQDPNLYANTKRPDQRSNFKNRPLNQTLDWHLESVSFDAGQALYQMATLRLPGLSSETTERILRPSDSHGRFAWQNNGVSALQMLKEKSIGPTLVFNMAGTGAGKTQMNAKCACVLGGTRVRFANVLNLRTLTLQTGHAYRTQLQMGADELTVIIGDKIASALDSGRKKSDIPAEGSVDEDENPYESELVVEDAQANRLESAPWMAEFLKDKTDTQAVITTPVLISTIDFVIAAGDPSRQGRHVEALLRMLDSDLILDEIDSYDPKPLAAVLRLIQTTAMCGRNVICSSATLSQPVAEAIHDAFSTGLKLRQALTREEASKSNSYVFLDDLLPPETLSLAVDFSSAYKKRVDRMMDQLAKQKKYRIPELELVESKNELGWMNSVKVACIRMHERHRWNSGQDEKLVSFGLVRVANIRTAIELARFLAVSLQEAKIACYHANDFKIQRFMKEESLDSLLNRKNGNSHIKDHPAIQQYVKNSLLPHIAFIVVASPVEEIGRDHDFDWAVIEPSSSQSIVQTAGRVNRHRLVEIKEPNVALLQYNMKYCRPGPKNHSIFRYPGFDVHADDISYEPYDLKELIDWNNLHALDARVRFNEGAHRFSMLDNESITLSLKKFRQVFFSLGKPDIRLMGEGIYREYALRESSAQKELWKLDDVGEPEQFKFYRYEDTVPPGFVMKDASVIRIPKVQNDWLSMTEEEMKLACGRYSISSEEGMQFEINYGLGSDPMAQGYIDYDTSFGFMRKKRT